MKPPFLEQAHLDPLAPVWREGALSSTLARTLADFGARAGALAGVVRQADPEPDGEGLDRAALKRIGDALDVLARAVGGSS